MKSFSKFNIIKSKLNEGKKSFLDMILEPKYQYIEIEVPHYDYLRGNVLLSDIEMVVAEGPSIDIAQLINLLYLQFLYQVRKGADLSTLAHSVVNKMIECNIWNSTIMKKEKKLTGVTPNLFVLKEYDTAEIQEKPKQKQAFITIRMKISEIYRGEVFLHDIYNLNNDYIITVEELISMLYIDFIKTIKQAGNDEKVIYNIINAFEYFEHYM